MTPKSKRQLGVLMILALFILMVQVMLGGITRLTGSGLSITEWEVIGGTLPPLNQADWNEKFEQYKQIPQYQLLNKGMSLKEFKSIFFWEWMHRLWGRMGFLFLLGVMAVIGLQKKLDKRAFLLFGVLLFLYALQGLLGWFMVASGLSELTHVSHYRLAAHLVLALVLFSYILWWAANLLIPQNNKVYQPKFQRIAWGLTALILLQIVFGAFMSGLRIAGRYSSWPDMNGQAIPDNLFLEHLPFLLNFSENPTTIQFTHRGLAYLLFFLLMAYWWVARKWQNGRPWFGRGINFLPIVLITQIVLGITTLLLSSGDYVPVLWGVLHQFVGLTLLSVMLFVNFQYSSNPNAMIDTTDLEEVKTDQLLATN